MVLSGWKEVACYLHSAVRTIQRWERYGLPISRPTPGGRGQVMAESTDIDLWLRERVFRHNQGSSRLLNVERARQLRVAVQSARHTLHQKMSALRREVEMVRTTAEGLQRGRGGSKSKTPRSI